MPKVRVKADLGLPGVAKGSVEIEGDSCREVFKELDQCFSELRQRGSRVVISLLAMVPKVFLGSMKKVSMAKRSLKG